MKIRVLVVDDSAVVRRVISDAIETTPDIEVVGVAANGRIALAKLARLEVDLVTLDIEMPELDGLGTLAELRKTHPRLPVIMFSSLTRPGAEATLDALALGASDYVTKPSAQDLRAATAQLGDDLFPRIRALVARGPAAPAAPAPVPPPPRREPTGGRLELLAIGTSTGGPNALGELIPALPAAFPVPVVVVQHMPPMFTRLLAERLAARSSVPVHEVAAGQALAPGQVYLAPGDHHLEVERRAGGFVAKLHQGPPENSCRPAVDVLFRSVAREVGPGALGVILTGMGKDGFAGSQALRERGGHVLAQDEASSVVWGMPGYVARAGLADAVLPLGQLADELRRRFAPAGAPSARR